jgi:hypothetical protein
MCSKEEAILLVEQTWFRFVPIKTGLLAIDRICSGRLDKNEIFPYWITTCPPKKEVWG